MNKRQFFLCICFNHVTLEKENRTFHRESIEHNKYAVVIVFDNCLLKKVVGHVPLYWGKLAFKFLQFQNHSICVVVTGKRVNRGAVLVLRYLLITFFMEIVGS